MEGVEPVVVAWPLSDAQRTHVSHLSELVRRFGAGRFLHAHLVRADERDFPDPWEPTAAALYRLIYRLFWHAYIDAELDLDDLRNRPGSQAMLTNSSIDFVEARNNRAVYQVAAFGNDDIAGLVSHTIGEAFLALSPTLDPFRDMARDEAATIADSSIAACFLGLGVLVANSSMYRRYKTRLVGREAQSEARIERTGGLAIGDATLLLAIQLTVRDDVPDAVETLLGPQREWVDRWLAVLDPHEDELRRMLGLDAADQTLPPRAAEPRTPPATLVERALATRNEGRLSFRVPRTRTRVWAGLGIGFLAAVAARVFLGPSVELLLLLPIGAVGGLLVTRPGFQCYTCKHVMEGELDTCANCKITLQDTLVTRQAQQGRLAEWAQAAEDAVDPATAEEAERAYHPDV